MVIVPKRLSSSIRHIIEWHLETYMPERIFNIRLERILEHFYARNLVDGQVQVEESELYYIDECVSDATNYIPECGVEKDVVWDIYDWVVAERKKN